MIDTETVRVEEITKTNTGGRVLRWLASLRTLAGSIAFRRRVPALRLRESLALGERKSLLVVQWDGRSYLLGVTTQSLQVLDSREAVPGQDPVEAAGSRQ